MLVHPPRGALAEIATQLAMYRDTLKQHGYALPSVQPMRLDSYLAEKSEPAWSEAEALFELHYGVVRRWGAEGRHRTEVASSTSFREASADRYVIGTASAWRAWASRRTACRGRRSKR